MRPAIRSSEEGFSLVWLAIMLAVAGIVAAGTLPGGDAAGDHARAVLTLERMVKIEEATKGFMSANGRRPCPADITLAPDNVHSGIEAATPGTCSGGSPAANVAGSGGTANIVAGGVPTSTLGLPAEYASDGWGRRVVYAADRRATAASACKCLQGGLDPVPGITGDIDIRDGVGGASAGRAMWVLLSQGRDGHGAVPQQGGSMAGRRDTGSGDADTLNNAFGPDLADPAVPAAFVRKSPTATFDDIVWSADAAGSSSTRNRCCLAGACEDPDAGCVTPNAVEFQGKGMNSRVGYSTATGDVNNDGYADLVIGAVYEGNNSRSFSGSVYVVFGKATGWQTPINFSDGEWWDGTNGVRFDGPTASDQLGSEVAAGDVNGDGFDDVVMSAPYFEANARFQSGSVYVYFGKAGGWSATPYDLSSATRFDGTSGVRFDGAAVNNVLGQALAAGDVNGDGYDDVIISAYNADNNGRNDSGSTYVYFGKPGGWAGTHDLSSSAHFNGARGVRFDGAAAGDSLGDAVAAGDVNGDGRQDVIIGAAGADPSARASAGSVYVYFGKANGWAGTIDLNSATHYNGTNGVRFNGAAAADLLGMQAAAGDVNGDGRDDVLMSAAFASPSGRTQAGSVYVYFGKAGGWSGTPYDLSSATHYDGTNGVRFDGEEANDELGRHALAAEDLNGDGKADVVIGSPSANPSGINNAGSVYVYFGKAAGWSGTPYDLTSASHYDGTNGARLNGLDLDISDDFGIAVGAGDVNGDGATDLLVGAWQDDPLGVSGAGTTLLFFGRDTNWPSGTVDPDACAPEFDPPPPCPPATVSCDLPWGGEICDGQTVTAYQAPHVQSPAACASETRTCAAGVLSGTYTNESCNMRCSTNRLDGAGDENVGTEVFSADITGDGLAEVFAFAPNRGGADVGSVYVLLGKAGGYATPLAVSTFDGSNGFRLDFATTASRNVEMAAGDVNGDGLNDLVIAEIVTNEVVYVVFGKSTPWSASYTLNSTFLNGTNGFSLTMPAGESGWGIDLGDINGDGYDDILAGASSAGAGKVYVVFGKAAAFPSSSAISTHMTGTAGFRLDGVTAGDAVGSGVAAGDFNGDGFEDIMIGAAGKNNDGGFRGGGAYLIYGKRAGWGASHTLNSTFVNGGNGFLIDNPATWNAWANAWIYKHARRVRSGDLNGDGLADLVMMNEAARSGRGNPVGGAVVLFGTRARLPASQNLTATLVNGVNGFITLGWWSSGYYANYLRVGNINGDAYDDLVIAVPNWLPSLDMQAYVDVLYGKASGWPSFAYAAGDFNGDGFGEEDLNGTTGFRLRQTHYTQFTNAVAAGDVNGDGFDDVIHGIRGPTWETTGGKIQIAYGREAGAWDLTPSPNDGVPEADADAGGPYTPAYVGCTGLWDTRMDNGDRANAYANTAPLDCNTAKQVRRCVDGVVSGDSAHPYAACTAQPGQGTRYDGGVADERMGKRVAVGDVNGDGYTDTILTSYWGATGVGGAYVVFGGASCAGGAAFSMPSLNGTNGFRLLSPGSSSYGWSAGSADVNGDGYDDILLGSPNADNNGLGNSGSVYVVFGKASGWASSYTMDGTFLNGTNGFRMDGDVASAFVGYSLSGGDVNRDGYADIVVGSHQYNFLTGAVFLVFGKASGWASTYTLDTTFLNATNGVRFDGTMLNDTAGFSLAVGDFNGDGFKDILTGARGGGTGANPGKGYVIFGKASGWVSPTTLNGTFLNGTNGLTLNGTQTAPPAASSGQTGYAVAAGDVNRDGYADMLIGTPYYHDGTNWVGKVDIVFGKVSGWAASYTLNGAFLNATNGFSILGSAGEGPYLGLTGALGDITGDGYADIVMPAASNFGYGYVMFGKASGWAASDTANDALFTGTNGITLTMTPNDFELVNVAVGDINHDGTGDIVAAYPRGDPTGLDDAGKAWVVYGSSSAWSGTAYALDSLVSPNVCGVPWGGDVVAHGGTVTAYGDAVVPFGDSCAPEGRTCGNCVLSGSYLHPACSVAPEEPDACSP